MSEVIGETSKHQQAEARNAKYRAMDVADRIAKAEAAPGESTRQLARLREEQARG